MSLFFKRGFTLTDVGVSPRSGSTTGVPVVNGETAMRASAVWACLRLRADLISTMPIDVYRKVNDVNVNVNLPPLLVTPSPGVLANEWFYSTQMDLDRYGNCYGIVTSRDAAGKPSAIELIPAASMVVRGKGATITEYASGTNSWKPADVWHEKQYTVAGIPVGLSPITHAAWSIGGYLAAQKFALDWFGAGAAPAGVLKSTDQKMIPTSVMDAVKARFKLAVQDRDLFVTGKDWEFQPAEQDAAGSGWLEQMRYGVVDICRFLGVPADMIDGGQSGSSITYANVTQRNLQLLIVNLGPAIIRRELAISTLALATPRFMKFNTDALLRLSPETRTAVILSQVAGRTLAPSEARAIDDRLPFTDLQLAEFDRLWGKTNQPAQGVSTS